MATNFVEDSEDFQEEDSSYNFRQLMDSLILHKELIITVPSDQVKALKDGLIMRKSKDNRKTKAQGLLPTDDVLSFATYVPKDKETGKEISGQMAVRVKLGPKKSVNVLSMEVPDNEL